MRLQVMMHILVINCGVDDSVQSDHRYFIDFVGVPVRVTQDLADNLQVLIQSIEH